MAATPNRALVTLATGPHLDLLAVSEPLMQAYADRWGYDLIVADIESDRPASWLKVPVLKQALLDGYEQVLWVDADVAIIDPSRELTAPESAWQALVRHHTLDGEVPNCGVWLVRQPMVEILSRVWSNTGRLDHGWWEQAALMDLMGYQHDLRPAYLARQTVLYDKTHWLPNGFNYHVWDTPAPTHVWFAHASMFSDRQQTMTAWAAEGLPEAAPTCRHRYPIRNCVCEQWFAARAAA